MTTHAPCRTARTGRPPAPFVLLAAALLAAGCRRGGDAARFIPAEETARAALAAGLDAWKGGAAAGAVEGTKPLVFVTDSYRRPKERLVGYEILGLVPADAPRCFAVELRFDPPREEKTRYVVVGIDPLWVFRMEDYQLLTQWDHHMKDEPAGRPAETASPAAGGGRKP